MYQEGGAKDAKANNNTSGAREHVFLTALKPKISAKQFSFYSHTSL